MEVVTFMVLPNFLQYYSGGFSKNVIPYCIYFGIIISENWFILFISEKMLSWLNINTKEVVWRSPFHQTVRLQIEKCNYVGIADFAQHNRGLPVVRGDEISYIYLSTEPLPSKYCHRIDATKCKHGFIKFAYSDKLCQELISVLPEDKTKNLVSFYNRMQASDRINKLKQKKKRKKKN